MQEDAEAILGLGLATPSKHEAELQTCNEININHEICKSNVSCSDVRNMFVGLKSTLH